MPHQCTDCGRTFDDGSKEMLSGCPDCGGNKFQFLPGDDSSPPAAEDPPEPPEPPGADAAVARTVGNAAATVKDFVGSTSSPEFDDGPGPLDADETTPTPTGPEDAAQADARSQVVREDELPTDAPSPAIDDLPTGSSSSVASTAPSDSSEPLDDDSDSDRPDLAELREELNDQFESIRVVERGQYELNLMELYDREEYIIALQEDGRYTIQVPETWRD